MKCCCQFTNIGSLFNFPKENEYVKECEISTYLYQNILKDKSNKFVVPKQGHYLVYLTATGGDVKRALLHDYGTEVHLMYLNVGDEIIFSLGDTSKARFPDGFELVATKKENSYIEPLIAFQNLGDITPQAKIVDTYGGGFNYINRLDQYAGFHVKGIVPLKEDIDYMHTGRNSFHYWATTKVNFPKDGVYTFGTLGDDYTHLFLDGEPIVMYSDIKERHIKDENIPSTWGKDFSGGIAHVHVTAGEHTLYLYNINTVCCHIHSGMFAKDSEGNKIIASDEDGNWKYIRSPFNCLDEIKPEILLPQPYVPTPFENLPT